HPVHIAFALLNEGAGEGTSLFASVIQKAGGEPQSIKRGLQKLIVRLPTQNPPPDETSLSSAALKVLREAQNIQKNMHDSYIAQDHILLALIRESSEGTRRVQSKNVEKGLMTRSAISYNA
ncbi:hypothetical protein MPER_02739, partial [Moniliophthora perniciosa FA553]